MFTGSIGFQIGGEAKDIIIAFNTDEALKKFRAAKGWEAGVDGNLALFTVGGGGENTLS
jgi:lipid-binding SYLF domain-containing protein